MTLLSGMLKSSCSSAGILPSGLMARKSASSAPGMTVTLS